MIEALEREWRDALCSKDMDRLRALVHPDFLLIGTRSSGPFMMHRDEWLDAIQRRDVDSIELEVRDATVLDQVRNRPSIPSPTFAPPRASRAVRSTPSRLSPRSHPPRAHGPPSSATGWPRPR